MSRSWFLRLPGSSFPSEALTGDGVLDGYLRQLDGMLLGAKKVRLLTLAEIKDHLEERKASLLEAGRTENEALTEAVQQMGPLEEHARQQRRRLLRKFAIISLCFGVPFGLFQGWVTGWTDLLPWWLPVVRGVTLGVFAGPGIGWAVTFVWPEHRLPSRQDRTHEATAAFRVAFPRYERILGGFGAVILVLMAAAWVGASVVLALRVELWWTWLTPLLWGLLAVHSLYYARLTMRSFEVGGDGFWIREWTGRRRKVLWHNVKSVGRLGDAHTWIPRWTYWRKVRYIDYATEGGRVRRVNVLHNMPNADRLVFLAEDKLKATGSDADT